VAGKARFFDKKYYLRVEQTLRSNSETKGGDFLQKPKARHTEGVAKTLPT